MDDHEREVRRLRLEAREQRLDVEVAEAELVASQTQLVDVLCDWAAQGRHLIVDGVDRQRRGRVAHVGESVVTLMDDAGTLEVIALSHVEGLSAGKADGTASAGWVVGHPRSLIAHLRALVVDSPTVKVERRSSGPVRGQLSGVAETHVVLRLVSGDDALVPLGAIVSVTTES